MNSNYMTMDEVNKYVAQGKVTKFDENDDLQLFCYNEVDWDSDDTLKRIRGVVFDKQGNLVSRTFGATDEYIINQNDEKLYVDEKDVNDAWKYNGLHMFYSEEGTLLRLFCYNGVWYLSTHKKLDAQKSRWGSGKTFGEMFKEGLFSQYLFSQNFQDFVGCTTDNDNMEAVYKKFLTKLDVNNTYLFLVKSTKKNRLVCKQVSDEPQSLYLGYIDNNTQKYKGRENFSFLSCPEKISCNIVSTVKNMDHEKYQGIIVFNNDFTQSVKYINQTYHRGVRLRGNCPSIKFRYLELLHSKAERDIHEFVDLYSEHISEFSKIQEIINNICTQVHRIYMNRYINKQYVVTDSDLHILLKLIHNKFIQSRQPTTIITVKESFMDMTPVYMNRVIKKFHDIQL